MRETKWYKYCELKIELYYPFFQNRHRSKTEIKQIKRKISKFEQKHPDWKYKLTKNIFTLMKNDEWELK